LLAFVLTLHLISPQLGLPRPPAHNLRVLPVALADDAPIAPPPFEVQPPPVEAAPPAPPNLHLLPSPEGDLLAGSFSFAEYGLAALGNLVTWIGFGVAASQFGVAQGSEEAALTVVGLLSVPVVSSLIAWAVASQNAAGSFLKALLRAGLVQVGGVLLSLGLIVLGDAEEAPAVVGLVILGIVEFIGVPLAASFGMHAGPAVPEASPAMQARSELPALATARSVPQALNLGLRF